MLSAFKNFIITFAISLVIFGFASYFSVNYALEATAVSPDDTGVSVNGTFAPDDTSTPIGDIGDQPETQGNSFNVLLIGTDFQRERFDDYDPNLWLWADDKYEMKELSDATKYMQSGFFRYREIEADSMVVLRVDKERREVTFTYIPGSMIVLSEGGNIEIGSLYASKGVDFLRHKVEAVTGLVIDYHICVSVEEIKEVIDEIGTVEIEVPCDMEYTDEAQELTIDIGKGNRTLKGTGAEQVLRFGGYSDASMRGTTTVKYLMALMTKATRESNLTQITTLFSKISELVDTNITVEFLLSNAELIFSYSSYNCYEMTYPGKYSEGEDGETIFIPEVKNAVDMFYGHRLPYDITE